MAENKYEKYIVRRAMRPESFMDPIAAGFMTMPPLIFLNGDNPIKGANQFLEIVWIWDEGAAAVNPDRPLIHMNSTRFSSFSAPTTRIPTS